MDVNNHRVVVMDIDCTLYSYAEFLYANWSSPRQSLEAFAGFARSRSFPAVDRMWQMIEPHIEERISCLKERTGSKIVFVSAFPLEGPKGETLAKFAKMGIEAHSTFPQSKLGWSLDSGRARFVFGDRLSDYRLAIKLGVPWAGLPVWHRAHRLSGKQFTRSFLDSVDKIMERTRCEI
jgi:hypothetical protein